MKYWHKLLIDWHHTGHEGLTIPFIIGSQIYLANDNPKQNIKDLLVDIIHNKDITVGLKYCMNIKAIILIPYAEKYSRYGHYPTIDGNPQFGLIITSHILDNLGATCEEVIETLTEYFEKYINLEHYSINENEWGKYTPFESLFIKLSLLSI